MSSDTRPVRRKLRSLAGGTSVAMAALIMSCADAQVGGTADSRTQAQTTPTPRPGQSVLGGAVAGHEPTPRTTASPSASPTVVPPTPDATSTPREGAISVSISPSAVELSVPPGEGDGPPAGKPYFAQLSAFVVMADGSTSSAAIWRSLAPEIATVSATGLVTVLGPGPGTGPWTVGIEAKSQDGRASDVRLVKVTALGDVGVAVE